MDLEPFRNWLVEHGLSDGTIGVYIRDIRHCFDAGGVMTRLRNDELAPKTRRHILAAARRWAEYTEDVAMTKALKKLRLPPAKRKTAKVPLKREDLFSLVDELGSASYIDDPMRAVLGMMACRGLRCGDVLRLRHAEIDAAKESGTLSFEAKGRRRLEFRVLKTYRRFLDLLAAIPGSWTRVDEVISPGAGENGRRSAAARAVERSLTRVGVHCGVLGLYPHRLRRTYAVEYLRALHGDPEALVKLTQHMQWASMTTAMEYVDHARGDELNEVAERMFER